MRFDSVLACSDTAAIVSELDELSSTRRLTARGVLESRGRIRQFELSVDECEQWWIITYDDGARDSYREGLVSLHAMRQTLVVDETTGIGRKLIANHRGLIIAEVSGRQEWDPSLKPEFAKIDDWIRSEY